MPTFYLKQRAILLQERMDAIDCDPEKLACTYAQFAQVNALLSGWSRLYRAHLRPALQNGARSVLDIGCGGGDVICHLARLARLDGFSATFLGIDPDPRAIAFARQQPLAKNIQFEQSDLYAFSEKGEKDAKSDILLSNHVLHHLQDEEITELCKACERLAGVAVIHNDICRDDLAFALFPLVGGWFRGSYIKEDGLRSIRRAFIPSEIQALAPTGWRVQTSVPFRLQLLWNPPII
jgi:2-polyprenyl-3-methyl-5-hydroxy-6-metoxy-1,4-benzoquinol methylase